MDAFETLSWVRWSQMGGVVRQEHFQFPSHCGFFPDFGLGHDSCSYLNLSCGTSPQSNSYVIWKEFFRPWTKNHPFEVVEVGAMREKGYPLPGSVALKWQSTQLAVFICACLVAGDTCVLPCPLGLSSSCWLLEFADFSMWYYFFFCL